MDSLSRIRCRPPTCPAKYKMISRSYAYDTNNIIYEDGQYIYRVVLTLLCIKMYCIYLLHSLLLEYMIFFFRLKVFHFLHNFTWLSKHFFLKMALILTTFPSIFLLSQFLTFKHFENFSKTFLVKLSIFCTISFDFQNPPKRFLCINSLCWQRILLNIFYYHSYFIHRTPFRWITLKNICSGPFKKSF